MQNRSCRGRDRARTERGPAPCAPHSAMRRLETRGKRREKQQTAGSRANSSLLLSSAAIRAAAAEEVTGGRWFYIPFHLPVTTRLISLGTGRPGSSSSWKVSIIRLRDFTRIPLRGVAIFLPPSAVSTVLVSSSSSPGRSHWEWKVIRVPRRRWPMTTTVATATAEAPTRTPPPRFRYKSQVSFIYC